jgi:ankyrin repeat protein
MEGKMKKIVIFASILFLWISANASLFAEDIHDAAKAGDIDMLKALIGKDPALVSSLDSDRNTPLILAVDAGKLEASAFLIESGADVNAANYNKESPLHIAARKGNSEAVELLLEHNANPDLREQRDRTPLFLAVAMGRDLETVKLLIDAGAAVNDTNSSGENLFVTSLYYPVREIVDYLIDRGAAMPGDEEVVRRALYVTAANGLERPFRMAVEKCDQLNIDWWKGVSMHACARGGSAAITQSLMEKGHSIVERDRYGIEPLHVAAENGHSELVELFLSNGAGIDSSSIAGKTALHFAQENGHQDLAALLLRKGASQAPPEFPVLKGDYLGQEKPGNTPLMFAPGIVSGHHFSSEHSPAVFSPDLKEVYWTKQFRGPILCMKQENGVWSAPEPASFCSEYGDGEPIFSPDGRKLYFLSLRPLGPESPPDKETMWYVERTPSGWSEPKPVSPLINAHNLHWLFSVSDQGTIYFSSIKDGGFGLRDIYSSRLVNGEYEEPKNLGAVINGPGIDHTPFIASDESFLIYVSTENSADPGRSNFVISYRDDDVSWIEPVSLGDHIKFRGGGLCPAVTPDGKYMFFIGSGDIYWVSAGFIEELRPKK